ncbi:Flp family type IVb pilin [Devosia sp.]|uniref:Flp family type IVb pilin n=1 Tax=Devosia sp. TaxID=1871048 RepID=UPI00326326E7
MVDDAGATAIEYALLGTIIAVALAATFAVVGNNLANMFGGNAGNTIAAASTSIP